MARKIIAITGSYRKGGITDQTVEAVLAAAARNGAETLKVDLADKKIEFCVNCRACMQTEPDAGRGVCPIPDEMKGILDLAEGADALVFASPVNFGTVTALMKRFVERCAVYGYWPWGSPAPKSRPQKKIKKALLVTSSACPAFIARIFRQTSALDVMRKCAEVMGARKTRSLYFGMACSEEKQKLTAAQLKKAEAAGESLAAG